MSTLISIARENANLEREVQLKFRVTPAERALIERKMAQLGTTNMAAYLRKMAIDGYVVNLELPELREMVSLLRGPATTLTSSPAASMRPGNFMTLIWMNCGKAMTACGMRHRKF